MRRHLLKLVGIAALTLAIGATLVNQFTPHSGGTPSSSYATAADGLAGYAELLMESGHPVNRLRTSPARAGLDPHHTVVLLDPDVLLARDVRALRSFVIAGGRLIAGGREPGAWLTELLADAPRWSSPAVSSADVSVPVPETAGVQSVESDGTGAFTAAGSTLPVVGPANQALLTVASLGAGRVVLMADSSPLQNHLLAHADNAALGIAIAGAPARPVSFEEAVHGYGQRRGLAALPSRWKWALIGLLLAALLAVASKFRRLGPAVTPPAPPQPPRRAHVDALASALARTGRTAEAARPVQQHARDLILARARMRSDAGEREVLDAGARLGLDPYEARTVAGGSLADDDVLAAGRALAKLSGGSR